MKACLSITQTAAADIYTEVAAFLQIHDVKSPNVADFNLFFHGIPNTIVELDLDNGGDVKVDPNWVHRIKLAYVLTLALVHARMADITANHVYQSGGIKYIVRRGGAELVTM